MRHEKQVLLRAVLATPHVGAFYNILLAAVAAIESMGPTTAITQQSRDTQTLLKLCCHLVSCFISSTTYGSFVKGEWSAVVAPVRLLWGLPVL